LDTRKQSKKTLLGLFRDVCWIFRAGWLRQQQRREARQEVAFFRQTLQISDRGENTGAQKFNFALKIFQNCVFS